jgi:hypothetical protein
MAAFSSYILALAKNLYEKRVHQMLMKLTAARYLARSVVQRKTLRQKKIMKKKYLLIQ